MPRLEAKCEDCGKEGEVVTVTARNGKSDVTDKFLCVPCWKERRESGTARPPEGFSVGWLEGQ